MININSIDCNLHKQFTSYKKIILESFDLKNNFDVEQFGYLNQLYIKYLSICVKKYQPKLVLELGTRHGISCLGFANYSQVNNKIITVDWVQQKSFINKKILKFFPNINVVHGNCFDLTIFDNIPFNIDILFMDTEHTYDQAKTEFSIYEPLLSDTALIMVDDINLNDKYKFFRDFTGKKKNVKKLHASGFGLFLYKRINKLNKQERLLKASYNSIKALSKQNYSYLKKIKDIDKKFYLLPGRKVVRIFYKIFPNFLRVFIHKIIN
jgi:predicted O-methyltransferase YrrM